MLSVWRRCLGMLVLALGSVVALIVIVMRLKEAQYISSYLIAPCPEEHVHLLRWQTAQRVGMADLIRELWNIKAASLQSMPDVRSYLPTRAITTNLGSVILVYNPERSKKRLTKQSQERMKVSVRRPFNPRDFHFGMISSDEILMILTEDAQIQPQCQNMAAIQSLRQPIHAVIVNTSPLSIYSGMLIPFYRQQRSQEMTADALLIGIKLANSLQGSGIRVGFNSLFAGASVNHLHFQFWWTPYLLPIEEVETETISTSSYLKIQRSISYLSPFFRVSIGNGGDGAAIEAVIPVLQHLARRNIPYNLVLVSGSIYILPRKPMLKYLHSINVGFPEVSGSILVPDDITFKNITAQEVQYHWQEHVRVPDAEMDQLLEVFQT